VGTPLWLYQAEAIPQRVRQVSVFDCVRLANSNTHIIRLLRSTGVAVDAVSLGEIERALRAGYVPGTAAHEIVFTADIINKATLARVPQGGPLPWPPPLIGSGKSSDSRRGALDQRSR